MTPANRKTSPREAKEDQILDAAERQLLSGGYGALSVIGIGRLLGVAANTIYWYFPSKDHLFVAALERMSQRIVQGKPPHNAGFVEQTKWFVDRLAEMRPVRTAMHERAQVSEVVAVFERGFQGLLRQMLEGGLREHLPASSIRDSADVVLATIEGLLVTDKTPAQRHRILERLLSGLGVA